MTCKVLSSTTSVADITQYLITYSAHKQPPCLAAFEGSGSKPFRFYSSVRVDKLNVLDLGLVRAMSDKTNGIPTEFFNMPSTRSVGAMDTRFVQLHRITIIPKIRPFLQSKSQHQPGMTGLFRRSSLPFFWVCEMRFATVHPDNNDVTQCLLLWSHLYLRLKSHSRSPPIFPMTVSPIKKLQQACFDDCITISNTFLYQHKHEASPRHAPYTQALSRFWSLSAASTEENELLRKLSKQGYTNTNKKRNDISSEILQNRTK